MNLYIDIDDRVIIESPQYKVPVTGFNFMRGDQATVTVHFVSAYAALSATTPSRLITFGIKSQGVYGDGPFIVSSDVYTMGSTGFTFEPNFNTVELNSALNAVDGLSGNDIASVTGNLQVTWSDDGGTKWSSTNIVPVTIFNDLISGSEATPVASQTLIEYLQSQSPPVLSLSAAP